MRISDWSSDVCSSDLALDLHAIEIGAHGLRAARFPEQEIVGGIGALRDRAVEKIAERRRETAIQHHRPDRLMEEGEVVAAHGHRRLQAELALVRLGQRGQRDPEFADALLWKIGGAVIMAGPACLDVPYGDADIAVEGTAELFAARVGDPL